MHCKFEPVPTRDLPDNINTADIARGLYLYPDWDNLEPTGEANIQTYIEDNFVIP